VHRVTPGLIRKDQLVARDVESLGPVMPVATEEPPRHWREGLIPPLHVVCKQNAAELYQGTQQSPNITGNLDLHRNGLQVTRYKHASVATCCGQKKNEIRTGGTTNASTNTRTQTHTKSNAHNLTRKAELDCLSLQVNRTDFPNPPTPLEQVRVDEHRKPIAQSALEWVEAVTHIRTVSHGPQLLPLLRSQLLHIHRFRLAAASSVVTFLDLLCVERPSR